MKLFLAASSLLVSVIATAQPCPHDAVGWKNYRRSVAESIASYRGQHPGSLESKKHEVEGCLEGTSDKALADRCMGRVADFLKGPGISEAKLGFTVTDEEYYEKTEPFSRMPADIAGDEFLSTIRTWDDLSDFTNVVKKLNAARKEKGLPEIEYARYNGTIPSPDAANTRGRMLVYYPDPANNRDLWLSYGLPEGNRSRSTHLFAMSAVKKENGKFESYFRSWGRIMGQDGKINIGETPEGTILVACYNCHKSNAPLYLTADPKDAAHGAVLEKFNVQFKKYQAMTSPYDLSPFKGPSWGPVRERSDAFYDQCTGGKVAKESYKNLRDAMQCSKCHNGTYRGKIAAPLDYRRVVLPALASRMPPGLTSKLTKNEKDALLKCLHQEYWGPSDGKGAGLLFDYLVEPACE